MPHSQGQSNIPRVKSHGHFSLPWSFQIISRVPRPCVMFLNIYVVSLTPNLQAGGPLLVGGPRLLIQYIRSQKKLQAVLPSPIRVHSQRPLAPSVASFTLSAKDKGDKEMKPGAIIHYG